MLGFRQTSVHVFYFWFIRLHLPRRMNLFFISPSAPRARKRTPRAPTSPRKSPHGSCSATITPTAAPESAHRARALPHAQSKIGNPRTRSPKSSPESAPLLPPRPPQNHPFARTPKAASVNSYSKPAISYNAPRKVLPRRARCLLLHCHQDSNEIQIKK